MAKSAMSENMADANHAPNELYMNAYRTWAQGGAGLIITGNVMIDERALGEPKNVVVEDKRHFELLQRWAATAKATNTHLWPQINHPGRQAVGLLNQEVVAPSPIPVKVPRMEFMFKTPRALEEQEILEIIERYGNTALILKEAGFTGVQIHGAHGYLVSQFLSPRTNIRKDRWGGSLENRARFLLEVYRTIRKKVGPDFPVGIKINSADFQRGGFTEEESMEVVQMISNEAIDLIEISGGTYEKASMMGDGQKQSTREREAYFLEYIEKIRNLTDIPLMLTGGFRSKSVMEQAIAEGKLDIIGLARPFAVYPNLVNELFSGKRTEVHITPPKFGVAALDAQTGLELFWFEYQIRTLGLGKTPNPKLSPYRAFSHNFGGIMRKWVNQRFGI